MKFAFWSIAIHDAHESALYRLNYRISTEMHGKFLGMEINLLKLHLKNFPSFNDSALDVWWHSLTKFPPNIIKERLWILKEEPNHYEYRNRKFLHTMNSSRYFFKILSCKFLQHKHLSDMIKEKEYCFILSMYNLWLPRPGLLVLQKHYWLLYIISNNMTHNIFR